MEVLNMKSMGKAWESSGAADHGTSGSAHGPFTARMHDKGSSATTPPTRGPFRSEFCPVLASEHM